MGGVVLVAPEQRNSLLLKKHELRLKGGAASEKVLAALESLAALDVQDLMDESDELLHHR